MKAVPILSVLLPTECLNTTAYGSIPTADLSQDQKLEFWAAYLK